LVLRYSACSPLISPCDTHPGTDTTPTTTERRHTKWRTCAIVDSFLVSLLILLFLSLLFFFFVEMSQTRSSQFNFAMNK
jgi:hypothetical protein